MSAPNFFLRALLFSNKSACTYYRVQVPTEALVKQELVQLYLEDGTYAKGAELGLLYSDIALFYGVAGEHYLNQFRAIRKIKPGLRDGHEIYPPTIIYDIDDNCDFVHPFNSTFVRLGVRGYPDAQFLKPGDGLDITDSEGRKIARWEDEVTQADGTTFDIARNLKEMKVRHELMRTAHGVTVPSNGLARYMRDVIGIKNVYVFPNTVVPEHYENIPVMRTDDCVRILWQGGASHIIDWYPLRDALKTITQRHKNIKFVIFGELFPWIHGVIPDEMIEHHPWVSYEAYKLKRGLLNIDINLCPLVKNVFNICKSAIKWYEGSVWKNPEATLAANTPPYNEEIKDGETGLLYSTPEEFVEKLSLLIENADLRKRVSFGAREWVMENRTPEKTIPGLFDFYQETRAQHRREIGRPIIERPTLEQIKKVATPLR